MTSNEVLFAVVPYVVVVLAIVVTVMRWRNHPFSVSSLSSQLLESRKLYWGSISFHWGLSLVLVGHLLALVIPRGFEIWNGVALRLYLLEITGLALGLWAAFGITMLIVRRHSSARVRRVTSPMDVVVLLIVATQIATGLTIAVAYRWGSFWGTSVLVPYFRSLLRFQPDASFVEPLPWLIKAHVLSFFAFVAVFAFSRLVHIITLPLQYLFRPWQKVVAARATPEIAMGTPDQMWRSKLDLGLSVESEIALGSLRALSASGGSLTGHQLGDILHTSRVSIKDTMAKLVTQGWVHYEAGGEGRYDLLVDLDDIAIPSVVEAVEGRIVAFAGSSEPSTQPGEDGVTQK